MSLAVKRRAIQHLLDDKNPNDGMAAYFAFHHPNEKTELFIHPAEADKADGYVALSRTGIDLFRPLVTLRLPPGDMHASAQLAAQAFAPDTPVIVNSREEDYPIVSGLFQIQTEEILLTYVLDPGRFEPIINVLVTQDEGPNGLPRFVIRQNDNGNRVTAAAAGLNWLSPRFGEISVTTAAGYRRRGWGRSVVSAMVHYLLENGRVPLYAVSKDNEASMQLAESLGFRYRGGRLIMAQAIYRPPA